jgi:outer membrane protein assembly factor BamB
VVFGSDDGFVYRLAGDGKMVWKFKTGGKVQAGIAVSKDEDFLYAASMDGNLYALYPELGEEKWRVQTAGPIRASPMLDSEARIYVGSRDHNLYAVDTAGGDLLWRLDLGCEIDSTAAVVADRGLVVGSDDGVVHVFKEMQ